MLKGDEYMATPKSILEQALKMRPADRFTILEGLLHSLDEPDKTIDEIWAIEAEKRLQAYKEGKLIALTYEEVFGQEPTQS
jgi:putative addiction module component (TIGR02574 family)